MSRALRAACVLVWLAPYFAGCGGGSSVSDSGRDATTASCANDLDCDDGRFCNGEEACLDGACVAGAPILCADDLDCTRDHCDEGRHACIHEAPDEDGDGHATVDCGGDDCDDGDANRFPDNVEVCDADDHDEDCDSTTFGFRDADGDGWPDADCCNVDAAGARVCGDDCDDSLPAAHPSEAESCDGIDNDCDGTVDEGVSTTFYADADADGHGDGMGETREACFAPDGFAALGDDCDDAEARRFPGNVEVCDSARLDEDCDGTANPDSLCNCSAGASRACVLPGICASGTQDCVDGMWGACSVAPTPEICDGADSDCDGLTDEGLTVTCFGDADGDGFAATGAGAEERCPDAARAFVSGCPRGTTDRAPLGAMNLDCDDGDASRVPGAAERCDGVDNDCDGAVDEGVSLRCYVDGDRDGYGVGAGVDLCPAPGTSGCPDGYTGNDPTATPDCDDADPTVSPGAAERCDGADDDCDGSIDEGVKIDCYVDADADGFAASGATSTARCPASPTAPCPAGETARAPTDARTTDCDDADARRSPSVIERCDHLDNDCDGTVDEGLTVTRYADEDADGFGAGPLLATCPAEPGFADTATDCDDSRAEIHPGSLFSSSEPNCPPGATTCDVMQGALKARVGCMVGGRCMDDPTYWDFNCDGNVDVSSPVHGTSCLYQPVGPTYMSCTDDPRGDLCAGVAGASWDPAIVGAPCGLVPPDASWVVCRCTGRGIGGVGGDTGCITGGDGCGFCPASGTDQITRGILCH